MGLFSREEAPRSEYSLLNFDKLEVEKTLKDIAPRLFAERSSVAHKDFVDFVETLRNREILALAEGDVKEEDYRYRRGRADALSDILRLRSFMIEEMKNLQAKEAKKSSDKTAKRSYFPKHAQAGLSV